MKTIAPFKMPIHPITRASFILLSITVTLANALTLPLSYPYPHSQVPAGRSGKWLSRRDDDDDDDDGDDDDGDKESSSPRWTPSRIAGAAIGGVLGFLILFILLPFCIWRRFRTRGRTQLRSKSKDKEGKEGEGKYERYGYSGLPWGSWWRLDPGGKERWGRERQREMREMEVPMSLRVEEGNER